MSTETFTKKRFTVDEYCRLWEVGILPEDGRFELIRGEIIEMCAPGSRHAGRVNRMTHLFTEKLGRSVVVSVQNGIPLDMYSFPLPDMAILKGRADFYTDSHPSPADVLLVIEVSDSTVGYDKNVKSPLYAEAGISEYWQLDVNKEVLIVRTEPASGEYRNVQILHRGDALTLQNAPHLTLSVDEILG